MYQNTPYTVWELHVLGSQELGSQELHRICYDLINKNSTKPTNSNIGIHVSRILKLQGLRYNTNLAFFTL